MAHKKKRLLVAVDCSNRALQTAKYAGEEEAFKGMKIVLFHVFNKIPNAYYDLEKEPKSVRVVSHVRSWEASQKKEAQRYMKEAKALLVAAGHDERAVEIKIQNRRIGIARDIIAEAKNGYDAVLIRRRGTTALTNVVLGSVSAKLLEKLAFMPVLIAGRKPVNKRVLVAVDGSACANRAVHFVADTLGPLDDYQICLFHAIRGKGLARLAEFKKSSIEDATTVIEKAVKILIKGGFDEEAISSKTVTGARSRAGAIVKEAEKGGWGTVVLGRRGLSRIKGYFIGSVSNKVVYAGRKDTVWIIT